jgi:predicted adenine nucleotide alpha hydrolase (AANH) superfamily ATPase
MMYPYKVLAGKGASITGFFYNPNIHPYLEFQKRLQTLKQWLQGVDIRCIIRDDYVIEDFLRMVAFREAERCRLCYLMRLEAAAAVAKRGRFESFSTTLLYSKFQQHEVVREIGETVGKKYGVPFYYEDFRVGWKEGIRLSKENNLYRQQYCGCIYSEGERYRHLVKKEVDRK